MVSGTDDILGNIGELRGHQRALLELYQGENDFAAANTRIGEVRIEGLEPLPTGQHQLEVEFSIERSGIISTVCTSWPLSAAAAARLDAALVALMPVLTAPLAQRDPA